VKQDQWLALPGLDIVNVDPVRVDLVPFGLNGGCGEIHDALLGWSIAVRPR
jgi:hypothetical protein